MPERFVIFPDEYEEIWNRFESITQDGENVAREDINDLLDDVAWFDDRVPEGYLRWDDPVVEEVSTLEGNPYRPADGPEPVGQEKAKAMLGGYMAWQAYRLELALQADKLTQFGRRGRRPG